MIELPQEIKERKEREAKKEEELQLNEKETYASATTTAKIVLLLSFFLFLAGILISIVFNISFSDTITADPLIDSIIFNLGFFSLSIPFFAFLMPLIFLLKGTMITESITTNNLILIRVIPLFISSYAGMRTALLLNEDLNKKLNFKKYLKKSIIILVLGVILGIIIEIMLPTLPKISLIH